MPWAVFLVFFGLWCLPTLSSCTQLLFVPSVPWDGFISVHAQTSLDTVESQQEWDRGFRAITGQSVFLEGVL